jgi:hypothetical protein
MIFYPMIILAWIFSSLLHITCTYKHLMDFIFCVVQWRTQDNIKDHSRHSFDCFYFLSSYVVLPFRLFSAYHAHMLDVMQVHASVHGLDSMSKCIFVLYPDLHTYLPDSILELRGRNTAAQDMYVPFIDCKVIHHEDTCQTRTPYIRDYACWLHTFLLWCVYVCTQKRFQERATWY